MNGVVQDVRYAWRQLSKNPGFACTAILILAVGIGGTTAIFSTVNPILFEPLPYPHANRIMTIWYAGEDGSRIPQAFHTYREVAERTRSFAALAVMKTWQPTLVAEDQAERLEGQRVSAGYFRVLGIAPVLGRDFQPSDDVFNGPKIAILSDGLWRRRFAGDSTIVGRNVQLDDNDFTVIGVMSRSFENTLATSAEVWTPLQYNPGTVSSPDEREWGHHLKMVGRLRDGVSLAQANSDLGWIAKTRVAEFPRPNFVSLQHGMIVDRLQDDVTRGIKPALLAVFGAVLLVLLIACVNVTNLMLAQGAQRQGEIAMRAALGAARPRLVRQFVTESVLLFLIGGALGMLVANAGIKLLLAMSPGGLPRVNAIHLDAAAFAFAFGIAMFIGLVVGLVPAWHASRGNLQNSLQQGSQRTTGTHQATRRIFVVAEVAVAVVLLVTGGLLLHSLRRLFAVSPGFNASSMLTMQVQTYGHRYSDDQARHQFFDQALDAVRRVPGVTAAAFTSQLPLSGDFDGYGAHFVGDNPEISYPVFRYAVTDGYFSALDIPLLRGRVLDEHDTTNTPQVIVISESLAKSRFPSEDPIGKRVYVGSQTGEPFTVVGVVGDVKQVSLGLNDSDAVYITNRQWQWPDRTLSLVIRTRSNASTYVSSIKNAIWSIDRELPVVRVAMMDDLLAASAAERRFAVILFEAFGLVALALATTGIYGVLSGSVTERTREIGVRSALGASRRSIVELVLSQGMTLTGFGIAIGIAGALAASQAIASMLFGISRLDPFTYLSVSALLIAVSVIACSVPAWRAARIDPMVALRYE